MNAQSFFYWGLTDLESEVTDDIRAGLVQPQRSLFYARSYGAGIAAFENAPLAVSTIVKIKYEAVKFMAIRNSVVTDGNDGFPDRRAATSQDIVDIMQDEGGLVVQVPFIMLADMVRPKSVQVPIGGTS